MAQRSVQKILRILSLISVLLADTFYPFSVAKASSFPSPVAAKAQHKVAIVIDDFGNGMRGTDDMLDLGIPITVAVMPFLPTTKQDAESAFNKGHEVIVHLPMEPVHGKRSWLGPGSITTDLSEDEIRTRVRAAIADVPHATGINNHMGSKATSDPRVMRIIMQVCSEKGIFFLDSRTTNKSKAPEEAGRIGVPLLRNDIFLDDVYTATYVSKQLRKLSASAAEREETIAIGHVGPPGKITSSLLKLMIPALRPTVQFVHLSELLPFIVPLR